MNKLITYKNANNEKVVIVNSAIAMEKNNINILLNSFEESNNVNIYTTNGFMQDGATYEGNTIDKKDISIEITIFSESYLELSKSIQKINRVFNPKLNEGMLIYESDYINRKIKCIVNKLPSFVNLNQFTKKCIISLTAEDPYWQEYSEEIEKIASWDNKLIFPLRCTASEKIITGCRKPSLIANIKNDGDVAIGMTIEFLAKGSVKKPSLYNVNKRECIKIDYDMVAGDVISVNTNRNEKQIVLTRDSVKTDITNYIDIDNRTFLQLQEGDNLVKYDAEEGLDSLDVTVRYSAKFLGVM